MRSTARFWLIAIAAVVAVVLVVGGSGQEGPPLDPRSVSPDGARGVVEVLRGVGATVRLDDPMPGPDDTAALLLDDRLTSRDVAAIRGWVEDGGVLVVADLSSRLAARRTGVAESPIQQGVCTIEALRGAETLELRGAELGAGGRDSCFGTGNDGFIVAETFGLGTIVTIGGPTLFTNAALDEADAAVVALSLLAPRPSAAKVAFLGPSIIEFGDQELSEFGEEGLSELISPRVVNFIYQLLAAFLLYALYRARRLGRVVPEPVPVSIEGSELVLKSGLLSERSHDSAAAAAVLQDELATRARRLLSVPPGSDGSELAQAISLSTGVDAAAVFNALHTRALSEEQLVDLAVLLSEIDALLERNPQTRRKQHD